MVRKGPSSADPVTATHWSFNGSEFWSFDDTDTMQLKADYVNSPTRSLRGMMFWELSGDTADGRLVRVDALESRHATCRPLIRGGAGTARVDYWTRSRRRALVASRFGPGVVK